MLKMNNKETFQINIDRIIREKVTEKSKNIPSFLTKALAWLIKQDGLNDFLRFNGHDVGVDAMNNAVTYFDIKLKLNGIENIPMDGQKLVFASNHPLGGLDGICLSSALGKIFNGKIKYLVNDLLYFIRPLQPLFIPINKHGSQAKGGVQAINDAFTSDNQIITFPAGLCSRMQNGKISDPEWKKMFISKAIEYQRDIVPVYFEAKNSTFFYRLAIIRKILKIKFNIEMLFLPREMFKSKGSLFTIHFGKPVSWQTFDSSKSLQEWADWMKDSVYQIKKN